MSSPTSPMSLFLVHQSTGTSATPFYPSPESLSADAATLGVSTSTHESRVDGTQGKQSRSRMQFPRVTNFPPRSVLSVSPAPVTEQRLRTNPMGNSEVEESRLPASLFTERTSQHSQCPQRHANQVGPWTEHNCSQATEVALLMQ